MSKTTGIEWTDSTWNPWVGCRRVSPGCAHCYADRLVSGRMGRDFRTVTRSADRTFLAPLRWREPRRVFTCSISDFFIEEADAWRTDAWAVIRRTPHLTYQVLTKRPERIADRLPPDWGDGWPNVWLGVSGENWDWVRARGSILLAVPTRVRFLSAEPWLDDSAPNPCLAASSLVGQFEWVVLGGESGPGCRPMNLDSARSVRDATKLASASFFLKQLGGHPDKRSHEAAVLDGRRWTESPPWRGGP
jgi:protein gp37